MINLSPFELHIWIFDTCNSNYLHKYYNVLSKEEKYRSAKFLFKKDANNFLISHISTRLILAKYMKCFANEIIFNYNNFGKPYLNDNNLFFNLSHSGQKAIIAIYKQEVGVDIEYTNKKLDIASVAKFAFNDKENHQLELFEGENQKKEFFKLWTKKEAFLKAKGTGIVNNLKNIENDNYLSAYLEVNNENYIAAVAYEKGIIIPKIIYYYRPHAAHR